MKVGSLHQACVNVRRMQLSCIVIDCDDDDDDDDGGDSGGKDKEGNRSKQQFCVVYRLLTSIIRFAVACQ